MIFQSIKKYDEPVTTYSGSSSNTNFTWNSKTDEQKEEWTKRCQAALFCAKAILHPGDTVKLKINSNYVTIVSFIEVVENITSYREHPCFIMANNPAWGNNVTTRYSLEELDLDTIVHVESTKIIELPNQEIEDDC